MTLLVRAARVLCVAALLSTLLPSAAAAHAGLRSSTPAANARLAVAPTVLQLVFSETPELTFTRVTLAGPGGSVALGPVTASGKVARGVETTIRGTLSPGRYTVTWQVAGADGHPIRGTYAFTILGDPAAGIAPGNASDSVRGEVGASVPAPGADSLPAAHHDPMSMPSGGVFDAESPAYVAIRWLQFTALVALLGALAFRYATLAFMTRGNGTAVPLVPDARRRAAAAGLWAAALLAIVALMRLYAQSYAMHGSASALDVARMTAMLGQTSWGYGWLLQLAGVVLALIGFTIARRDGQAGWTTAAFAGLLLALSPALSGHAAAAPRWTGLAIAADTAHVIGAGGWLGGLLMLLIAGLPAAMRMPEGERGPAVADLVNAFSPTALGFASLAGLTGVFAGWIHMTRVSDLWQSSYGQTLLVKLAILSVVAGTGAYNWLRVKPALGTVDGAHRIRRSATVELVVGLLVLVVTAVLVATPTPMDASAMSR